MQSASTTRIFLDINFSKQRVHLISRVICLSVFFLFLKEKFMNIRRVVYMSKFRCFFIILRKVYHDENDTIVLKLITNVVRKYFIAIYKCYYVGNLLFFCLTLYYSTVPRIRYSTLLPCTGRSGANTIIQCLNIVGFCL